MSITKLRPATPAHGMNPEEGSDTLEALIRQAISKKPFLSFPRTDQLSGWPLLAPVKAQMQKCEKCSREFCSTINYRRHTRLHRRSLNFNKDSAAKNREILEFFWDKLSFEEAKETLSIKDKDTLLEDVNGSIIEELLSFIRQPGFSYPSAYIEAGKALLEIVQGVPSRFPLSSWELFNILDDASEKTFLCGGMAESLQKYVFADGARKIGLEMKNLIACSCFLIELKLVKAWLADKDAEALRCQKLLVEEEEAAQKRQTALLEKKRFKKLRQKEHRTKEQACLDALDSKEDVGIAGESDTCPSPRSPQDTSESNQQSADITRHKLLSFHEMDQTHVEDGSNEPQSGSDSGYPESHGLRSVEARMLHRNARRHLANSHWQSSKQQRNSIQNHHGMRLGPKQKHAAYRDTRVGASANVNKVWTPKPKSETEEKKHNCRSRNENRNLPDQCRNCELLIGSISVSLANCSSQHQGASNRQPPESSTSDLESHSSKHNRPTVKLWRPVSRNEDGGHPGVGSRRKESEVTDVACGVRDQSLTTSVGDVNNGSIVFGANSLGEGSERVGVLKFSKYDAEAFLSQRWEDAISSDHVKLVLVQEAEGPKCTGIQDDGEVAPASKTNILDGNCTVSSRTMETCTIKSKFKTEKGIKFIQESSGVRREIHENKHT